MVGNFVAEDHKDSHHTVVVVGRVDNSVIFGSGRLEVVADSIKVVNG